MWGFLGALLPGLLSLFTRGGGGGGGGGNSANISGVDPTLAALWPYMNQLLQQQRRQSLFTDPGAAPIFGMRAPEGAVPLQLALSRLAFSLLPTSAQQTPISPADPFTSAPLCGGPGQLPCAVCGGPGAPPCPPTGGGGPSPESCVQWCERHPGSQGYPGCECETAGNNNTMTTRQSPPPPGFSSLNLRQPSPQPPLLGGQTAMTNPLTQSLFGGPGLAPDYLALLRLAQQGPFA